MRGVFVVLSLLLNTLQGEEALEHYKLAKVPEASGICYSSAYDSLFVASDKGRVYEISKEGKRLRKAKFGKKYDLEGVACDDKAGILYFAVERSESILVVDMKSLKILKEIPIDRAYRNKLILKKDKKHGIEGITLIDGSLYLSNQSYRAYPNDDASIVFKVAIHNDQAKIVEIINHGFVDIAGLAYHNGYLYMTSDDKNLLIQYDIAHQKMIKTHKLPKFAQEGVTFDNEGFIYFADDKGRVIKMEAKGFK